MKEVAKQLYATGTFEDPARPRLIETRRAVIKQWTTIADTLEAQGEPALAKDVRHFVRTLPQTLTHREMLAKQYIDYIRNKEAQAIASPDNPRDFTR
jgi:hypothetical protein